MNAKFYDGKSSISIAVQIDQDVHGIFVKDRDCNILAYYAYPDLAVIETPIDSLPGIISSVMASDVRLLIEDPELFAKIQSRLKTKKQPFHVQFSWIALMVLFITAIMFAVLIFKLPYDYAHIIVESIPQSWDDKFGKYAAEAVTKDYVACTDSPGQKALEKLVNCDARL